MDISIVWQRPWWFCWLDILHWNLYYENNSHMIIAMTENKLPRRDQSWSNISLIYKQTLRLQEDACLCWFFFQSALCGGVGNNSWIKCDSLFLGGEWRPQWISWSEHSTPDRAVRVRALAGDIVLCSWVRHFTLTAPLSTQVYRWVPAILMLEVTLRWIIISSRGE